MRDDSSSMQGKRRADTAAWKEIVAKYQKPSTWRALWQIVNTLGPYLLLWYLMYLSLVVSWWLAVPLAILAGAFLVRVFIIHHDCGHGSFFKSRKANDILGFVTGVLTFTPYYHWRWEHAAHHATSGDLDRRGLGDIWTLTVLEYLESSRCTRFAYRLARNPVVLFVVAPLYLFLIKHRFSFCKASRRERHSGVLDESGSFGNGDRVELFFWGQGVLADPVGGDDGGWLGGGVAVLRAASVRGSLLGTRR